MSVMDLKKNLVSFSNTEVLQESDMRLALGFSILFNFRFRKCRECRQSGERGMNDLSGFSGSAGCSVFICRHYF